MFKVENKAPSEMVSDLTCKLFYKIALPDS